ncbi:MAG: DUF4346 domain-containing protein [Thermoplasmata archaeon]|nr:DUF4346 domain-containing protein [Thermoplasmata archaeon]
MERIEAHSRHGEILDTSGFFVILVDQDRGEIVVEHYENVSKGKIKVATGRLAHVVTGKDAQSVGDTLIERGLLSRLDHAVYMGRELQKAEAALMKHSEYVQDE